MSRSIRRARVCATMAAVTLLSGCAAFGVGGNQGSAFSDILRGSTFDAVGISGFTMPTDGIITVRFDEGELRFCATCNSFFGPATVNGDLLIVNQLAGTEMGCPGDDRHARDEWLAQLFSSSPHIQYSNNELTITNGENQLVLARRLPMDYATYENPQPSDQLVAVTPVDYMEWQVVDRNGCLILTNAEYGQVLPVFPINRGRIDFAPGDNANLRGDGPLPEPIPLQTSRGTFTPSTLVIPDTCPTNLPIWVVW